MSPSRLAFVTRALSTHLNAVSSTHFSRLGMLSSCTSFTFFSARTRPVNSLSASKSTPQHSSRKPLFMTRRVSPISSPQNTSFPNVSFFSEGKSIDDALNQHSPRNRTTEHCGKQPSSILIVSSASHSATSNTPSVPLEKEPAPISTLSRLARPFSSRPTTYWSAFFPTISSFRFLYTLNSNSVMSSSLRAIVFTLRNFTSLSTSSKSASVLITFSPSLFATSVMTYTFASSENSIGFEYSMGIFLILEAMLNRRLELPSCTMRSTESFTKGCYSLPHNAAITCINSSTEALFSTSFTRHRLTKSVNPEDQLGEDIEGGSSLITRFMMTAMVLPQYGFFPSAISISDIPRDQTSLFSTVFPLYASGAMYQDVPLAVLLLEQECSNWTANPKSPNLINPFSEMSRLSGLMSYP